MVLGKVVKNKAYYKRYQVKYRRRREGKTDYRARLRLCTQDKNKYMTPKYRYVVRFTNKDIICQITYATIAGDITIASAYSHELPDYGLKVGLTNYAAAYCTGLLLARRLLTQLDLQDKFVGVEEVDGELNEVEEDEESGRRPFKALLDAGLKKTTTGSKIFGALKGALDGGLNIPHSEKRFPGYIDKKYDAEMHKGYIFGSHVAEYMGTMEEEEPEKYQTHFKNYVDEDIDGDGLEDLYSEVHEKIREKPLREKKERKKPDEKKRWKPVKLTYEERKERLLERIEALREADEE